MGFAALKNQCAKKSSKGHRVRNLRSRARRISFLAGAQRLSPESNAMPDVLFILVLALVIFGPAKLPHLARELARYRAQFKQIQRALMQQVEAEISNIESQAPNNALTIASGAGHENVTSNKSI